VRARTGLLLGLLGLGFDGNRVRVRVELYIRMILGIIFVFGVGSKGFGFCVGFM
jgi:hypothetical protein